MHIKKSNLNTKIYIFFLIELLVHELKWNSIIILRWVTIVINVIPVGQCCVIRWCNNRRQLQFLRFYFEFQKKGISDFEYLIRRERRAWSWTIDAHQDMQERKHQRPTFSLGWLSPIRLSEGNQTWPILFFRSCPERQNSK